MFGAALVENVVPFNFLSFISCPRLCKVYPTSFGGDTIT